MSNRVVSNEATFILSQELARLAVQERFVECSDKIVVDYIIDHAHTYAELAESIIEKISYVQ